MRHLRKQSQWGICLAVLLLFGPVLFLMATSLSQWDDLTQIWTWAGYGQQLRNSFIYGFGSVLVATSVGIPLAYALLRIPFFGRRVLMGIVLAIAFIPLSVLAAFLIYTWNPRMTLGLAAVGTSDWMLLVQAIWITGIARIPWAILLSMLFFIHSQRSWEESAVLDTGRFGVFCHVTLPLFLRVGAYSGCVLFAVIIGEIGVTDLVGLRTLAEEVYALMQLHQNPMTTLIGVMGSLVPILLLWLLILFFGKGASSWQEYFQLEYDSTTSIKLTTRNSLILSTGIWTVASVLWLYPFWRLNGKISNWGNAWTHVINFWPETLFTFTHALIAAGIITLVAVALLLQGTRHHRILGGLALLAFFVPGSVVGISLILILNQPGPLGWIYDHSAVIVLGLFFSLSPG